MCFWIKSGSPCLFVETPSDWDLTLPLLLVLRQSISTPLSPEVHFPEVCVTETKSQTRVCLRRIHHIEEKVVICETLNNIGDSGLNIRSTNLKQYSIIELKSTFIFTH